MLMGLQLAQINGSSISKRIGKFEGSMSTQIFLKLFLYIEEGEKYK